MGYTADASFETFPWLILSDSLKLIESGSGSFKKYIIIIHYLGSSPGSGQDDISISICVRLKQREKRVSRAYGGSRCAHCVRSRIVRAFLIEESARGVFRVAMGNHEVDFEISYDCED